MEKSERWEKGTAKMKQLFGHGPIPGLMSPDFQKITVENLFGDIGNWGHPLKGLCQEKKHPRLQERAFFFLQSTR